MDRGLRLARLWSGERDEIDLRIDPCNWGNDPAFAYTLTLSATTEHYDEHLADWTTRSWEFTGGSWDEVVSYALGFAEELAALAPAEDD